MIVSFIRITIFSFALILLTGLAYPLAVTGLAQTLFPKQANGSLIEKDGKIIGSELIAQGFTGPGYFHPRPSAAGSGYAGDNSGASNLGVTSKVLLDGYAQRIQAEKQANDPNVKIPADLITASGSGLDPDITPEAALYQASRIAQTRGLETGAVESLIKRMTKGPDLGFLGMSRVNVLALNLELDRIAANQQPAGL
jgi:K+-transporting ATPase ATPase C chain